MVMERCLDEKVCKTCMRIRSSLLKQTKIHGSIAPIHTSVEPSRVRQLAVLYLCMSSTFRMFFLQINHTKLQNKINVHMMCSSLLWRLLNNVSRIYVANRNNH